MSQIGLIKKYKNVLVTRTLSKAYGLAGMRFGYALGHKEVIGQISAALLPWNVGTIPMWAALAALEDTEALADRVKFNNNEVDFIEESLSEIPGLNIFHSHSNYILFDGTDTGKPGSELVSYAQEKGLIFRPQNAMYGRDGWFRLTLGSKEENRMAVDTIREFYSH
jgi:histidinol-phosphate aminotransferase